MSESLGIHALCIFLIFGQRAYLMKHKLESSVSIYFLKLNLLKATFISADPLSQSSDWLYPAWQLPCQGHPISHMDHEGPLGQDHATNSSLMLVKMSKEMLNELETLDSHLVFQYADNLD